MHREDIDPKSGSRLPLPRREDLDEAGRRIYDSLADPTGGTLRGLRGPGGILLHSPQFARYARALNRYLRYEAGLGGRVRELAILSRPASSIVSSNGQRMNPRRSAKASPAISSKSLSIGSTRTASTRPMRSLSNSVARSSVKGKLRRGPLPGLRSTLAPRPWSISLR